MKLSVTVVHDERGYTAYCPSLPGCSCRGDTSHEAIVRLDEAIEGYLAALGNYTPARVQREVVEVQEKNTGIDEAAPA